MEQQKEMSEMDNQETEPSTSTSEKNGTGSRLSILVKDEQVEKKLKKETETGIDGQVEVNVKSFDDLPTEMVMKILKNLEDVALFCCRLVNRQFSRVASEILQSNANVELNFECYKFKEVMRIIGINGISLKQLIKCFGKSVNFPCSRLHFDEVQSSLFAHEDWLKLITQHGDRIKCLILVMEEISGDYKFTKLTKDLRALLLNQLPNLNQLGLHFTRGGASSLINLFPKTTSSEAIRLPHLKVFYLEESSFSSHTQIVMDVLRAAVNLRRIELFPGRQLRHQEIHSFYFLQSLGKLHLLHCASIEVTPKLLSSFKKRIATTGLDFKLKELELCVRSIRENQIYWADVTIFLLYLFESSKDTLRDLKINSLGFLTDLKFPTFSKLTSLRIDNGYVYGHENVNISPSGLNLREVFPVLRSLDLQVPWASAFSNFDNVPSFPSLKTLQVFADGLNENLIAQISSGSPNLKSFKTNRTLPNFPEVGTAIWTHLTKLKALELKIAVDCPKNANQAIDCCITGISKQECERLHNLNAAEKLLKKARSKVKIPDSEWETQKENVSISNLKDLKVFTLHLISGKPDITEVTAVSEKYLKVMGNFTFKIARH